MPGKQFTFNVDFVKFKTSQLCSTQIKEGSIFSENFQMIQNYAFAISHKTRN